MHGHVVCVPRAFLKMKWGFQAYCTRLLDTVKQWYTYCAYLKSCLKNLHPEVTINSVWTSCSWNMAIDFVGAIIGTNPYGLGHSILILHWYHYLTLLPLQICLHTSLIAIRCNFLLTGLHIFFLIGKHFEYIVWYGMVWYGYTRTMSLFNSLQQSLMELQQDQLSELGAWLTNMEAKISEFSTKIQSIETLEAVRRYHHYYQILFILLIRKGARIIR